MIKKIFIAFLIFLVMGIAGESLAAGNSIKVERVNDGDTITARVDGNPERIRLIGIDAPELGQEPWGRRAKAHLKKIFDLFSWNASIEYDVVRRDKYGRLLAYVRTKDGKMVNMEMLRDGYAFLFTFPPNIKYVEQFTDAQRYARDRKLEIWGETGLKQMPGDYRKEHPRIR